MALFLLLFKIQDTTSKNEREVGMALWIVTSSLHKKWLALLISLRLAFDTVEWFISQRSKKFFKVNAELYEQSNGTCGRAVCRELHSPQKRLAEMGLGFGTPYSPLSLSTVGKDDYTFCPGSQVGRGDIFSCVEWPTSSHLGHSVGQPCYDGRSHGYQWLNGEMLRGLWFHLTYPDFSWLMQRY